MIVVNKTDQNRTINLKDFYEVKGLLGSKSVELGVALLFDWKKDHRIIIGPKNDLTYPIKNINDIFLL